MQKNSAPGSIRFAAPRRWWSPSTAPSHCGNTLWSEKNSTTCSPSAATKKQPLKSTQNWSSWLSRLAERCSPKIGGERGNAPETDDATAAEGAKDNVANPTSAVRTAGTTLAYLNR